MSLAAFRAPVVLAGRESEQPLSSRPPPSPSSSLIPKTVIREMIDMAHQHDVYVSTGNWAEHLVGKGPSAFKEYVEV